MSDYYRDRGLSGAPFINLTSKTKRGPKSEVVMVAVVGGQRGKVSLTELQLYTCNLCIMNNAPSCILNQRSLRFLSGDTCTDLTTYGFSFQFISFIFFSFCCGYKITSVKIKMH